MSTTNMFFDIFGRDRGVSDVFDRVSSRGHGVTKALGGITAAAAGIGLEKVFKTGLSEAEDAQAGIAQLEAGIKSTGGAAGVTTDHMTELASSIQGTTGQTDDSIVSAESLLLTFTNIKNSGTDKIFDDTTVAVSDMSARMGMDAPSAAIILGKALNDPVKGLTALQRVGIQFTDAQKEQIKAMVKAGDTAGAQKIILGELNKEMGGSATAAGKTLPGQIAIMKRTFEDVSQSLVEKLLPTFQKIITFVQDIMKWFQNLSPSAQNMVTTLLAVVAVAGPLVLIVGHMATAFNAIVGVIKNVRAAFVLMNAVLAANPFVLVILGIAALVAGLIWAYNNVGWFKDFVDQAFKVIQQVVGAVIDYITGTLVPLFINGWQNASNQFQAVSTFIQNAFQNVSNFIGGAIDGIVGFFRDMGTNISNVWNNIVSGVQTAAGQVIDTFSGLPGRILGFFAGAGGWLLDIGSKIIGGLISGIQGALGGLGNVLGSVTQFIADHKGPEDVDRALLVPHGGWIIGGLAGSIRNNLPVLQGALGAVTSAISNGVNADGTLALGTAGARAMSGVDNVRSNQAPIDLHGYTLKLNADATMATFQRNTGTAVAAAINDANDDIYRGRAR